MLQISKIIILSYVATLIQISLYIRFQSYLGSVFNISQKNMLKVDVHIHARNDQSAFNAVHNLYTIQ